MIPASPSPRSPAHRRAAGPPRWQRQWREAVRDPRELLAMLGLDRLAARMSDAARRSSRCACRAASSRACATAIRTTRCCGRCCRWTTRTAPCRASASTRSATRAARTPHGVIQKYRGRALLVATGSCAVHCRYCFRRHFPYAEETAAAGGWREAVDRASRDPTIEEVILSGGDPLSLATPKLAELTDALAAIPHMRRLRIHTRLPVVLPERVDDAACSPGCAALPWPVTVVLHANHANEFDAGVDAASRAARPAPRCSTRPCCCAGSTTTSRRWPR